MIASLDHLVLTVRNLDATLAFYRDGLGMEVVTFGEGRTALAFGNQRINLHVAGAEIAPHATSPTSGSGDLCFLLAIPLDGAIETLRQRGIAIELGPVPRTGAQGPIRSVYLRDPDGNLVELSERIDGSPAQIFDVS